MDSGWRKDSRVERRKPSSTRPRHFTRRTAACRTTRTAHPRIRLRHAGEIMRVGLRRRQTDLYKYQPEFTSHAYQYERQQDTPHGH